MSDVGPGAEATADGTTIGDARGATDTTPLGQSSLDLQQLALLIAAQQQFQLGITEDLALERCLQGLMCEPVIVNEAEARWVVCRLAELLHWPLPEWAELPAT